MDAEPACAAILAKLVRKGFPSLRKIIEEDKPRVPRGLLNALCLGVLRNYKLLGHLLAYCGAPRPPAVPRTRRQWLLLIGAYEAVFRKQLPASRIVEKTGLGEDTVACLRSLDPEDALKNMSGLQRLSVKYSMPLWVVRKLAELDPPGGLEALLEAFQRPTPLWLRYNTSRLSREEAVEALSRHGIEAEPDTVLDDMLMVVKAEPGAIERLPRSLFYPQDRAAAVPAHLLRAKAAPRSVLDFFSAPGNKLAQLQWLRGPAPAAAIDVSPPRLASERRLHAEQGVAATVDYLVADARRPPVRGSAADAAILDPDCTSMGRLGHSPETRLFLEEAGPSLVHRLARLQLRSLVEAAQRLRRGGLLVYSTCTLTLDENEGVIEKAVGAGLLEPVEDVEPLVGVPGRVPGSQRIYPHLSRSTGGFAALLKRP